ENVDYPELIWEYFAFQIDHRKEKRSSRETLPLPRFTKVIINHFLFEHQSYNKLHYLHTHTIKDDGIVRLKFVRIGEDYQEYGLFIPDTMLTEAIKQSESYQMFIKYSTSQIPPNKSIGKGSQGKNSANVPKLDVDVLEKSDSEPARKRTASRRVIKKKVTIFADDNIIPNPDISLELGKSISLTEVAEEASVSTVLQYSSLNVRGMENVDYPELIWEYFAFQINHRKEKRSSRETLPFSRFTKVIINHFLFEHQSHNKLHYLHTHTIKDDGIVRLKFVRIEYDPEPTRRRPSGIAFRDTSSMSKKISLDPFLKLNGIGGSNEGTGRIPGDPDGSTVVSATSNERTGTKTGVPDEEKVTYEENVIFKWGSEQESEYSEEDQSADEDVDWIYFNKDDEKKNDVDDDKIIDLEMTDDLEIKDEFVHGEEQVNDDKDEEMTEAEVAKLEKGDEEIADTAKNDVEKTKEVMDDAKKAKLPPTSSSLSVYSGFGDQFLKLSSDTSLVGTIKGTTYDEINSLLEVNIQQEIPHIQSLSVLNVLVFVISEPSILTPILETPSVAPTTTLLPSQSVSTIPHVLQQQATPIPTPPITIESPAIITVIPESDSPLEIRKIKKQKLPKYTMQSTNKATLKEYGQKSALYQTMNEKKSFNRNPTNHALYHALIEALIEEENAMDKGVADTLKNHKRQHNDNDDDDDNEDPFAGPNQDKKTKRRRTKDSESSKKPSTTKEASKGKAPSKSSKTDVVLDDVQPKDASKLKTDKTPNHNCIELEYNMEEYFKALTDRLDWNNLEGDHCPFDLTKPLPMKGRPDHLTVAAEYFFNNDLEFLKSADPEKSHRVSRVSFVQKIKL
nr:hypothetical protein [Tanacetum cinerariifolium]